jgi:hypothetical protein
MGSWNATCGITQLPITEGARVVLIPLVVKQQDFMARDALNGAACVSNDLIAQPIALPIYGTYDSYGGVDVEKDDRGLALLADMLQELAGKGELLREKSANPKPLKKLSKDFFAEMLEGRLLIGVRNVRKEWLVDLKKTIAEHGDGSGAGFEHYQEQLKVDPATLPDTLQFALGAMLVPRELYDGLCDTVGKHEAYGYFEEKTGTLVNFKGCRRDELAHYASIKPEHRTRVDEALKQFEEGLAAGELTAAQVTMVRAQLPLACVPQALNIQGQFLFYRSAGNAALAASVLTEDVTARTLWVQMMLFSTALTWMRKQWTVQAGGGSSAGLEEGGAALYQVTANFLNKTLADHAGCEAETVSDD